MSDIQFYSLDRIHQENADYNLIIGERSNGKTSAVLELILKNWIDNGKQGAYVRRYEEEIKGKKGAMIWGSIADERGLVREYTNGKWETIVYYGRAWYLAKYDRKLDQTVRQDEPFCFAVALNQGEHHKGGNGFHHVNIILFDEFLTRHRHLIDEFVLWQNVLSTIIRHRDKMRFYMLANTVNKHSIYFDEMGLTRMDEMEQGDLHTYTLRDDERDLTLKIAVEYCESTAKKNGGKGKPSDKYFIFDNPKIRMITGGTWELPMYPHAPTKIHQRNIIEHFFIEHRKTILQGDIVYQDDGMFIFIHKKTTPIRDDDKMIYRLQPSPKINHAVSLTDRFRNDIAREIGNLFRTGQVYYQNNTIGELVRDYILLSSNQLTAV